uniref:Uncharacterized protein n=1 Tax=Parascaris equorum TaxID=6256 RepID=A0A914R7L6_PAREQ
MFAGGGTRRSIRSFSGTYEHDYEAAWAGLFLVRIGPDIVSKLRKNGHSYARRGIFRAHKLPMLWDLR